jgi:hypothetical protein
MQNTVWGAEQDWTVNDMRLIDADALFAEIENDYKNANGMRRRGLNEALDSIADAPTIDAVPVVRKPVVGYEGYYEVDQFGRVFGLDRSVVVVDGNRSYTKHLKGRQIKQAMHGKGYKVVTLTKDGKMANLYVHRIVAEAFLPNPDNLPMVNHKDEDKANNFVENLGWCTAAYNRTYGNAVENHAKTLIGRKSEKRIPVIQRYVDGTFVKQFDSVSEAALAVQGAAGAISAVCKGKRKLAYGYRWEYAFCSYGERKEDEGNV